MTIYLDNEFKCYIFNDGTMRPYETSLFDDKCQTFIEGYRCIPTDEVWIREDGAEFIGLMISPWEDYAKLERAQFEYEHELLERLKEQNTEYEAALIEIEDALDTTEG